jgi:beta-glucosidase
MNLVAATPVFCNEFCAIEVGFKYLVVSDCGAVTDFFTTHKVSSDAVHAASKAVLAGTDVECVWENYPFKDLPAAVEKGLLKEEDINKSLMRVLIGRFDLGDFDDDAIVPWAQIPASVLNNEKHRQISFGDGTSNHDSAAKYKKNVLRWSKSTKQIAVIGPNAGR